LHILFLSPAVSIESRSAQIFEQHSDGYSLLYNSTISQSYSNGIEKWT